MLSLYVTPQRPVINLAGTIRSLAYPEISNKWVALSGDYLPVLDNPVLVGLFGFTYGQKVFDGVIYFRLPTWNSTSSPVPSIYPRPMNRKNSGGRNLGKSILTVVPSSIRAHTHPGSTSSDGNHSHGAIATGSLSLPPGPWGNNGGLYPLNYGTTSSSVGHGTHSHGGGVSGNMSLDAAHTSPEVEPKGYGAILCIHRG